MSTRKINFFREVGLVTLYLVGYCVLLFPFLLLIFDGRAIAAELLYFRDTVLFPDSRSEVESMQLGLAQVTAHQSPAFSPTPPNTSAGSAIASGDANMGGTNPFPEAEASLYVPKIKIAAPIIFSSDPTNRAMLQVLKKGVGHYPTSARFGDSGVAIVLGHSSAYPTYHGNYGSVFSLLDKLDVGDEFFVFYQGKRLVYKIEKTQIVVPADFKVQNFDSASHVILMSCWPVGTNWKRVVVFATLEPSGAIN